MKFAWTKTYQVEITEKHFMAMKEYFWGEDYDIRDYIHYNNPYSQMLFEVVTDWLMDFHNDWYATMAQHDVEELASFFKEYLRGC